MWGGKILQLLSNTALYHGNGTWHTITMEDLYEVIGGLSSQMTYTVSQKNCANLFLSELRQIYTNFDNIWQKDGKEAKIIRGELIFHLT